jgi:hypothetical protein
MIGTDMIGNNRIQMRLDFYTCDKMYRKESQKTDKLLLETKKIIILKMKRQTHSKE